MGLDYSYLLFFEREQVWDVLQYIARDSGHHRVPIKVIFPDHQISIALMSWSLNNNEMHHDDQKLDFQITLYFSGEDAEILEYNRNMGNERPDRPPPDGDGKEKIAIGIIYLSVYLNDEDYSSPDSVLF